MTPLQLRVLIHSHLCRTWDGMEILKNGNETWSLQTSELIANGMIEKSPQRELNCFPYKTTEKGKAWIEFILKVPYPIQEWKIPNV